MYNVSKQHMLMKVVKNNRPSNLKCWADFCSMSKFGSYFWITDSDIFLYWNENNSEIVKIRHIINIF